MFARLAILATLAASSLANLYMTSPVASTVCQGDSTCTISWQDDGTSPSLANFSDATVGLYVGSTDQQSQLQLVTDKVDVSTTASIQFTVDPSAGQDSSDYFIRITSIDGKNGSSNYEVFSAKFQITGMTGTFNSTILAQIADEDAQISSESAAATATGSTTAKSSSSSSAKSSGSSSSTGSAASSSASTSSAGRVEIASGIVGVAGAFAAVLSML